MPAPATNPGGGSARRSEHRDLQAKSRSSLTRYTAECLRWPGAGSYRGRPARRPYLEQILCSVALPVPVHTLPQDILQETVNERALEYAYLCLDPGMHSKPRATPDSRFWPIIYAATRQYGDKRYLVWGTS